MRRSSLITKGITSLLAGTALLVGPATAPADARAGAAADATGTGAPSSPGCAVFTTAQETVEQDLAARVTALQTLTTTVNGAAHLSSGDQSTLASDLSSDLEGIQALQGQAQQATTCPQLRLVAKEMVRDYRVYMVVTPQVHLTVAADTATWAASYLDEVEPQLQQALTLASQAGKNVTAAQAAFTDMQSQVTTAQSAVSGVASTVLAQNAGGAPANKQVFLGARNSLMSARTDLRDADKDFHTIMSAIG